MIKLSLVVFLVACLFAGCSKPMMGVNSLAGLKKGMHRAAVTKVLKDTSDFIVDVECNGYRYVVDKYQILVEVIKSSGAGVGGAPGPTYTISNSQSLLLIYSNNALLYWGQYGELLKSEDPYIEKIAPTIISTVKKKTNEP